MRPILYFLLGVTIAAVLIIPTANAATLIKQADGTLAVIQKNLDGTATYTKIKDSAGNIIAEKNLGTKTIGAAQGARVPVTIDVIAKKTLSKDLLAKAAVKNLRLGVLGTVGVVADVIQALDIHYDPTCNCIVQGTPPAEGTIPATATPNSVISGTYTYDYSNGCNQNSIGTVTNVAASGTDGTAACNQIESLRAADYSACTNWGTMPSFTAWSPNKCNYSNGGAYGLGLTCPSGSTESNGQCVGTVYSCSSGYTLSGQTCTQDDTSEQLTDDAAKDLIKLAEPPWPDFLEDLADDPGEGVDTSDAGPATNDIEATPGSSSEISPGATPGSYDVKSPKRLTDNGDGTRSEETTTVHITNEGDTTNYTVTNTTNIVNNTTNQTVTTSTETNSGSATQPTGGVVTDTELPEITPLVSMPEVPDFYQQKYPDGFGGAWDQFKVAIDQTSFVQLIDQLTPDWSAGTCPTWSLSFDMGFVNLGSHTLDVCNVLVLLKVIFIVSALFVARGLIFGG